MGSWPVFGEKKVGGKGEARFKGRWLLSSIACCQKTIRSLCLRRRLFCMLLPSYNPDQVYASDTLLKADFMTEQAPEPSAKKRSLVSIPFLLFAVALLIGGYFGGPWLMTQVFFLQEQSKVAQGNASFDVPKDRPTLAGLGSGGGGGGSSGEGSQGENGEAEDMEAQLEAIFVKRDADMNNKIEGEEISERLKGRMDELDTDKDGAISKDEFMDGMKKMRSEPNSDEM